MPNNREGTEEMTKAVAKVYEGVVSGIKDAERNLDYVITIKDTWWTRRVI